MPTPRIFPGLLFILALAAGCSSPRHETDSASLGDEGRSDAKPPVAAKAETAPPSVPSPAPVAPPLPAATAEKLRSLGYLSGPAPSAKPAASADSSSAPARNAAAAAAVQENLPEADLGGTYGSAAMPEEAPAPAFASRQAVRGAASVYVPGGGFVRGEGRERYQHVDDNATKIVSKDPLSTFSLDVDTGAYSNVRRFLASGHLPPQDAVRVEEMVNYFPYDYPAPDGEDPFGVRTELAPCPWQKDHLLMRVAVRADEVAATSMPPVNLVFLVDVSGSMDEPDKLPLLQSSLKLLAAQLRHQDRVSLAVYAGREAVVLEPTVGDDHAAIEGAIDRLSAGGSTAGEAGIRLAYRMAREAFVKGGINRVLLATDGDFNVGVTSFEDLKKLVERERESGVQLSTLGFGTGNLNDAMMEQLADAGNGSYAYIDTLAEGRKVLVDQVRSTLVTVAKDVKVQVEFNPSAVAEYRLIGYENRVLAAEDFRNDKVDAGDVGAGQSVTALYELTPVGAAPSVDPLRYAGPSDGKRAPAVEAPREIAFVKVRYKRPGEDSSRLKSLAVEPGAVMASFDRAGEDFRFAAAVAGFGQLLRHGRSSGSWSMDDVLATAIAARGRDEFGYRSEFVSLVRNAKVAS